MRKTLLIIFVIGISLSLLIGCGNKINASGENKPVTQIESATPGNSSKGTQDAAKAPSDEKKQQENADKALLNNISVTFKADSLLKDGKQRMIVYIENDSPKIFTGDVNVEFKNDAGKILGYDIAVVEKLGIRQKTYCSIYITPSDTIKMNYDYANDYTFEETVTSSEGTLDSSNSSKLTNMMHEDFGGNDNAQFATSWYKDIKSLQVYNSKDGYYAVAVVTTTDKEAINAIGNAILFSFEDVNLNTVFVKDETGNILLQKSK